MDGARTGLGSRGLGVNRDYSHRYVRREEWSDSGAGVFSARPVDLHSVGGHTYRQPRAGNTQNTPLVSRCGPLGILWIDVSILWHCLSASCARASRCSHRRLHTSNRQVADTHFPPLTHHTARDPQIAGHPGVYWNPFHLVVPADGTLGVGYPEVSFNGQYEEGP